MAEMRSFSVTVDENNINRKGKIGLFHQLKAFLWWSDFGIMLRIPFTDEKERRNIYGI